MEYKFTNFCINSPLAYDRDDLLIYYNTLYRSLIILPKKIHRYIVEKQYNRIDQQNFEKLIQGFFLIPEFVDEKKSSIEVFARQAYDMSVVDISILTTYDCNFNCWYCNQKGLSNEIYNLYLNSETSKHILQWIINLDKKYTPRDVVIGFFGGEPTLNFDSILFLAEQLKFKLHNKVKFWMTTNGFLLEPAISKQLCDMGVTYYQITIDGPQLIHDKRRVQKNGGPTFEKILSNVEFLCKELNAGVTISINIDQENASHLNELLTVLESRSIKNLIKLNIAGLIPTRNKKIRDKIITEKPISNSDLIAHATLKGFHLLEVFDDGLCPYNSKHTFVIDPLGDFYKCVASVGDPKFKSGSVMNAPLDKFLYMNHAGNVPWLKNEAANCTNCSFLPLCWGGCRNQANLQQGSVDAIQCRKEIFLQNTPDYLRSLVVRKRFSNIHF
ncbi:MAG TPA: radical SAM protein [Caldisericia bacterium]|nr:radical SAM protein [Caldisericia bacterium]